MYSESIAPLLYLLVMCNALLNAFQESTVVYIPDTRSIFSLVAGPLSSVPITDGRPVSVVFTDKLCNVITI